MIWSITHFQGFRWLAIKSLLTDSGITTLSEDDYALLRSYNPQHPKDYTELWLSQLRYHLSAKVHEHTSDDGQDNISDAIYLTHYCKHKYKLLQDRLLLIVNAYQRNPDSDNWRKVAYKNLSDYFGDLRHVADADNITVATGKTISANRVMILGKIEGINREVENVFENRDWKTLAELTGEPEENFDYPMRVNRYKQPSERAKLILMADRVFRARRHYQEDTAHHRRGEPKAPQLPTNKYNNITNPEVVDVYLEELASLSLDMVTDSTDEHDWLETLQSVFDDSEDEPELDPEISEFCAETSSVIHHISTPPANINDESSDKLSPENIFLEQMNTLPPLIKLGLYLSFDTPSNQLLASLTDYDLACINFNRPTWNLLAQAAGQTPYLFRKQVDEALSNIQAAFNRSIKPLENANDHE